MSWVRLDDQFHSHPKVLFAGNEAAGVYARALAYCGAYYTDGFVTRSWAKQISMVKVLDKITRAELWFEVVSGEQREVSDRKDSGGRKLDDVFLRFREDGFFIPDYLHHNPTKVEVESARKKRRDAGSKGGASTSEANAEALAVADAKQTPGITPSISPSRPVDVEPRAVKGNGDGPGFFTKRHELRSLNDGRAA